MVLNERADEMSQLWLGRHELGFVQYPNIP